MQAYNPTDPLFAAQSWIEAGHKVALGTVISTWGSAPRRPGSQIAVREDGGFVGSVSGGCVEGAVIEAACAALVDGKIRRLEFGVADEAAWTVGLACGGNIAVAVVPVTTVSGVMALAAINACRRAVRTVVSAIDLSNGAWMTIDPMADTSPLAAPAAEAARLDRCETVKIDGMNWFLIPHNPPVDLVIVGAVHVAQILTRMAAFMGYQARVIDPRTSFATTERFPDVVLIHAYPDEAFALSPLGARSAVVTLAHDPKIDDPALAVALASPAFYVGALGSTKTQGAIRARLKACGVPVDALKRIHGPVGLPIGGKSPEEIALSIVAEITQVLRTP